MRGGAGMSRVPPRGVYGPSRPSMAQSVGLAPVAVTVDLIAAGERVWWDQDILPGEDWELAVRLAMQESYAVAVCLSAETEKRSRSGVYPELRDAVEMYREYAPGNVFLFPVCLSPCAIPALKIDGTTMLDRLQRVELFPLTSWSDGVQRLVEAVRRAPEHP